MIKSLTYSFKEGIKQLFRSKVMTLVSLISISAMLLILGLFFFLSVNVNYMSDKIQDEFNTIEVFLKEDVSETAARNLADDLMKLQEIRKIDYISKDQAMEEFREEWGDNGYLLDGLTENPLPNALRITLEDLSGGDIVAELCKTTEGVEDVRYYQTEVNKILSISSAIQKGALVIIVFLIIVSVVVVSNTVKLTVMAREEEIKIMKYVGATNWFVRGPLLTEGVLIGGISALIAFGLSYLIYDRLCDSLSSQTVMLLNMQLVEPGFLMSSLIWIFMSLGISIGAFGSLVSMRRFLKV
ncbi:MAG: permease-like cell division protein FtsX [Firmicutes bacterium]|nr:permease-like cell division protein FtsX [Bacillota bacterium]